MKIQYCDALIIGGGLVGATLATAFGQAGLDVAVVVKDEPQFLREFRD